MTKPSNDHEFLYFGTTERIAKQAPVMGLLVDDDPLYLSDVYPGYFAFYASTNPEERFGIVELSMADLQPDEFLPCEWYLEQLAKREARAGKGRSKGLDWYRKNLDRHQKHWKASLRGIGVCTYQRSIPKKAVRRVMIYDPQSNPVITKTIVEARISLDEHRSSYARNHALTRWLLTADVSPEDWLGVRAIADKDERDKLAETLQSKWGLDVFYNGPVRLT
jgi:hypothetical protein